MSRGRDDDRSNRPSDGGADIRPTSMPDRPLDPNRSALDRLSAHQPDRRPELPITRLLLPSGPNREVVTANARTYHLRGSETQLLATVGAFRVVREDDLASNRFDAQGVNAELRRLASDGLVERRTIPINHQPTRIVVLTRAGQSLLGDHRDSSPDVRDQAYHSGLTKRRELAHDAQLYRLFQTEAAAIEAKGGRIDRVVVDVELKRDYQTFLNRPDRPKAGDHDREQDAEVFGRAHGLPVVDGHLQLPDLRIEYEIEGRLERRDLELVTEHYSRGHVAAKARAGFALYRATRHGGHGGRGSAKRGGSPQDPHYLRQLS
jgi:hypothetical protein